MNQFPILVTEGLTGHSSYMSPYECFDNCGTCDGALCHRCRKVFVVENYETGKRRTCETKEEADDIVREWSRELGIDLS